MAKRFLGDRAREIVEEVSGLLGQAAQPVNQITEDASAGTAGLLRNVFPAPQRMFDPADKAYKPFLEPFGQTPGGRYLEMGPDGPKDITGEYPSSAQLGVGPDGKPKFQVAPTQATSIPDPKGPGRKIKTNLAKKKTGWQWTQAPEGYDPNPDGGFPIVSVNDGKDHYYTLNTDFPEGVELARYPNESSEPRLKPTRKGHVSLGDKVGEIEMRGKKHPVYNNISIRQAAPVAMAGLLGVGMSEESEASILGPLSKLGAGRQDLLGMAKKMANEGEDGIDIRSRTGWELGADGQWRTELPNTETKLNIPEIEEGRQYYAGTIADIVDDPELLSQYEKGGRKPTVRDMDGEIEEYGSRGTYGPLGDIEFVVDGNMPADQGFHKEGHLGSNGEWQPEVIVISGKSSPAEQRATVLHELQHAIQDREGFASGGAARNFQEEERIRDVFYKGVGLTPAGSKRLQELEAKSNEAGQASMSIKELNELERLKVEKQIADRFNADTVGEAGARSPYGMYRGLMGEVEARNVETRDRMSPDFLKQTPLEFSEDVFEPRSQQIFRAGSDDELFNELAVLDLPNFRSDASSLSDAAGVAGLLGAGYMASDYGIDQSPQDRVNQIVDRFGITERDKEIAQSGVGYIEGVDPGIRKTYEGYLGEMLGGGREDYRRARNLSAVVDFTPVGVLTALTDYEDAKQSGDTLGMVINGTATLMAAIPAVGPGLKNSIKKLAKKGDDFDVGSMASEIDGLLTKVGREGVGKSGERVATTGQYIGGPAGVDTPEKVEAMIASYINDVELGQAGADWYQDSSNWIDQVSPPGQRQGVADAIGVTSQGTNVDSNLGFAIKGINQKAAGLPVATGRFPGNQSPLIEDALSGERSRLGPKRQPFADNLSVSWNPEQADTAVNDIWQGRAFGYTHPDGKPWDAGFSPQQHAFMDENMLVIQDRLNQMKLGGRTDWDNLNTQAAAWSGAKIRAGDIVGEDAATHYGDFADKYAVNATYEQAPGAGTGQLEGLLGLPYDKRQEFEDVASWMSSKGIDDLYSSGGLLAEPTETMVGAYTPQSTGILEINPGKVARPLVQSSGGEIIPTEARLLDIGESSRAYIDVQNAGAYHRVIPDSQTKVSERTGITVDLDQSPKPEKMAELSALAENYGFFAVDTGKGVNFISDIYTPIGAERTGSSLGKELKGDLGKEIQELTGAPFSRAKIQTGYEDYESAWQAGEGSGAATKQFLDKLDENPTFALNVEPALQRKALANISRDDAMNLPQREDVRTARKILIEKGISGLRLALENKALLPATVMGVLSPAVISQMKSDDAQTSGGLLTGI
jgi:hypothetical protein